MLSAHPDLAVLKCALIERRPTITESEASTARNLSPTVPNGSRTLRALIPESLCGPILRHRLPIAAVRGYYVNRMAHPTRKSTTPHNSATTAARPCWPGGRQRPRRHGRTNRPPAHSGRGPGPPTAPPARSTRSRAPRTSGPSAAHGAETPHHPRPRTGRCLPRRERPRPGSTPRTPGPKLSIRRRRRSSLRYRPPWASGASARRSGDAAAGFGSEARPAHDQTGRQQHDTLHPGSTNLGQHPGHVLANLATNDPTYSRS